MVRVCCECMKHLPDGLEHLAIIGCYYNGKTKNCVSCEEAESCRLRLVYPDDASHGLCNDCFQKVMDELHNVK